MIRNLKSTSRLKQVWASCFLALAVLFLTTQSVANDGQPVAIEGAKIVVSPGNIIEKGNVVVRDGMIQAVGESVEIPYDAKVINGEGLVVYSGFIDSGSNKGLPSGEESGRVSGSGSDERDVDLDTEFVAKTRQVNRKGIFPDYSSARFVNVSQDDERAWRAAGFTSVHIMPGDAILAGTSTLVSLKDWQSTATRDNILRSDVAAVAGWRASGSGYPSSLMGSVAHIRQAMLDAQHYRTSWEIYERVRTGITRPPIDPAMEAIGNMLNRSVPVVFSASDVDDIFRVNQIADEFQLSVVLDGMQFGYEVIDELKEMNAPVILHVNFPEEPELGKNLATRRGRGGFGGFGRGGGGGDEPDKRIPVPNGLHDVQHAKWLEQVQNPAALAAANIPFAFSTASTSNPGEFFEKLQIAIDNGLSTDAALAALTTTPAELFGMGDLLGTVETGKMGDLVVMTADLGTEDAKVHYTIVNGNVFESKEAREKSDEASDEESGDDEEESAESGDEESEEPSSRRGRGNRRGRGDRPSGGDDEEEEVKLADWPIETDETRVPKTKTGGNVLIKNANVVTAVTGELANTDILVVDGMIKDIGRDLTAPQGVHVVDGTDSWVIPGIIDCHSHMVAGGNEGTMSVTSEVRAIDNMRSSDLTVFRAAAGGVTAANVLHGSANTIGGQRIIIQMKYKASPEEMLFKGFKPGIKFALGENVIRSETRYPHTRMGVESVLRLAFEEARQYKRAWDEYNALSDDEKSRTIPPRRDLRLEALQQVLDNELLVHCHCYNAGEILMLLHTFTRYGIRNLTLEHGLEAFKVAPEIVKFGENGAHLSTFADFWGYKVEAYDAIPYNVAIMNAAGGVAILNSDSGERVRRLYHDAAKMVRWGGISYQDAIRTITLNPAIALQIDDQVGSIEVGKKADLALFNGHPLNTFSRPFMTLIDGEVVFEREGERGGPYPLEQKSGVAASLPAINANGVYAITNTKIVPITSPPIDRGTIVIKDGKISDFGASVAAPDDATIIDGSNLEVYPGMIDGGSDVAVAALGLSDSNEKGDIQPDLMAASALKPDSPLVGIARFTGITSSVTTPSGGLISGQSALVQLDGWNFDEMAVAPSLALEMALPRDEEMPEGGPRRFGRRPRTEPEESTEPKPKPELTPRERVLKLFADAREYDRIKKAAAERGDDPPTFDKDLEAIVPFANKERPVVIRVRTATDILDAIEFAKEIDIQAVLRDSGTESWKVADQLREAGIPILIGQVTRSPSSSYDPYDTVFSLPAKLHEAGVLFGFHTSSNTHARDLPLQPGIAVGFGLSEQAALEAVTINTAKIYGVDNQLGSIEVGKRADIIVTDRNPLQATSNVIHMFIGGKPVDVDDNMHTDLYKKYNRRVSGDDEPSPDTGG